MAKLTSPKVGRQLELATPDGAPCKQAVADKFQEAAGLRPAFWLRGQAITPVPAGVSLLQAGVPAEVILRGQLA